MTISAAHLGLQFTDALIVAQEPAPQVPKSTVVGGRRILHGANLPLGDISNVIYRTSLSLTIDRFIFTQRVAAHLLLSMPTHSLFTLSRLP